MVARQKAPTLREIQVKHFVQHYLQQRFEKESDQTIADSLTPRLSKAAVNHARVYQRSIGEDMIQAIANAACGGSKDRLEKEAAELARRDGLQVPAATLANDPELSAALQFLSNAPVGRDRIPDEFLRAWATSENQGNWKGMTRFDFVDMIRGAWMGKFTPAASRLEAERAKKQPPRKRS